LSELAEVKENQSDANRKALEYKRTSLAPFVETFESFVQSVVKEGAVHEKVKSEPMDF
uniref:Uncharacterized protein n=1 Tax=Plectus sambesii TaxID=2011161 RepID=A0A914UNM8_9BILA